MRHEIARTPSGQLVYVDLIHSPAVHDIADHPYLLALAKEVLAAATLTEPTVRAAYDLGRPVGHDFVVATTEADTIFYARLHGDKLFTRLSKMASRPSPNGCRWRPRETQQATTSYRPSTLASSARRNQAANPRQPKASRTGLATPWCSTGNAYKCIPSQKTVRTS